MMKGFYGGSLWRKGRVAAYLRSEQHITGDNLWGICATSWKTKPKKIHDT